MDHKQCVTECRTPSRYSNLVRTPSTRRASRLLAIARRRNNRQGTGSPLRIRQSPEEVAAWRPPHHEPWDRASGVQETPGSLRSSHRERTSSLYSEDARSRLILNSFLPMPCASYQCNSAKPRVPPLTSMTATPFSFRQEPRPYAFHNRLRSRTPPPAAMTSMCVISPTISKYIDAIVMAAVPHVRPLLANVGPWFRSYPG